MARKHGGMFEMSKGKVMARILAYIVAVVLPFGAMAESFAVLANPATGRVLGVIVPEGAEISLSTIQRCGSACEFMDILLPGQCMAIAVAPQDRSWGWQSGGRHEGAFLRDMAMRSCNQYSNYRCQSAGVICN